MDNKYIDVVPDQPVDESFNHEARELDVPEFPQGKQHVVTTKVTVADENGNLCEKEVGVSQGRLSPNPGYGEDGETKDATKTKLVKGEVHVDGGEFVNQEGIRVERGPVNFVGGLFVKGKPVGTAEEGSDDSNVYRFSQNEVMTEEIAATLKSGDVLLVNNMAFVINKINSDHTWFRGFYTDGSVEGKVSVALLNWEDTGTKQLTITWNEVSGGGGIKLYHHDITLVLNNQERPIFSLVCTYENAITKEFISSYGNRLEGFFKGDSAVMFIGAPFPNAGFIAVRAVKEITITVGETDIQNILQSVNTTYSLADIESIIDLVTEL